MKHHALPEDVIRTIQRCIDRLETLDVLVAFQRTPTKTWTKDELSAAMRSSFFSVGTVLYQLAEAGLIVRQGDAYLYRPRSTALGEQAARLITYYREKRTAVTTAILSRSQGLSRITRE